MSSPELDEIVDVGNQLCDPLFLSHSQFHLPDLLTPKLAGLQRRWASTLIVVGTDSEVLRPVLFDFSRCHPLL